MHSIRYATSVDVDEASEVLAVSFLKDPLMTHIWPDASARRRDLGRYFAAGLRHHHIPGGAVRLAITPDGEIAGVAVWDPPGRWQQPTGSLLRAAPQLISALRAQLPTALSVRQCLDRVHPRSSHWYLCHLGTVPNRRGQGIARELLKDQLQRCDERSEDAYLVSTHEQTKSLYQSVGFTDVDQPVRLSRVGPILWPMRRPSMP